MIYSKNIQLFAFSHAGGTINFYKDLRLHLDSFIDFIPIEYPGHGLRMSELLINNMDDFIYDACNKIIENRNNMPFALMGYSLGSTVCYESYFKLKQFYDLSPEHIFFMANTAPFSENDEEDISGLDDDEFLTKLEEYGGITKEFLSYPDLVEFYLPILRADVALSECNTHKMKQIDCDVSIIYSDSDNKHNNIKEWDKCANAKCEYYEYSGKHFFMNENSENIAKIINDTLLK